MLLALLVSLSAAQAELPAPDYREVLVAAAESEADALIAAGELEAALALVERFRAEVADHPRLVYEEGLVRRLSGDSDAALELLEASVASDPTLAHAWYDLGEVRLQRGDEGGAAEAFERASEMSEQHPQGWAGPFRLAELAGRRGDAAGFERWLKEALRRGFTFRVVVQDPTWKGFLSTPGLSEILRRMATVYGNEEVIRTWESG